MAEPGNEIHSLQKNVRMVEVLKSTKKFPRTWPHITAHAATPRIKSKCADGIRARARGRKVLTAALGGSIVRFAGQSYSESRAYFLLRTLSEVFVPRPRDAVRHTAMASHEKYLSLGAQAPSRKERANRSP